MMSAAQKGPLDNFSEAILRYNRAREVGSRILRQDAPVCRLGVTNGPSAAPRGRSVPGGRADEIRVKAEVTARKSVVGGRPDLPRARLKLRLLAITGITPIGGFLQDQLVHSQMGDGASQPEVLTLLVNAGMSTPISTPCLRLRAPCALRRRGRRRSSGASCPRNREPTSCARL